MVCVVSRGVVGTGSVGTPATEQARSSSLGVIQSGNGTRQLGHEPCKPAHCTRHCIWVAARQQGYQVAVSAPVPVSTTSHRQTPQRGTMSCSGATSPAGTGAEAPSTGSGGGRGVVRSMDVGCSLILFFFCMFFFFFGWVVVLVGGRSGRLVVDVKGQPEKQFQGVGQEAESRNLLFSAVSTGSAKE